MLEARGKYNTAKIFTDNIDETAYQQVVNLCNQKAFEHAKIRIMPDTHAGKGCVIGFTADLKNKVIPNLVGVDIGCGMEVTELGEIEIDFESLDKFIRHQIPHGHGIHSKAVHHVDEKLQKRIEEISQKTSTKLDRHLRSVGTLGGGNHFIEINVDSNGKKYLVIHSGSRNLGLQVANYHQKKAQKLIDAQIKEIQQNMKKETAKLKEKGHDQDVQKVIEEYNEKLNELKVPKDLTYLEGKAAEEYLDDMQAAQKFAMLNRKGMAKQIVEFLGLDYSKLNRFTSVHNYIDFEDGIIRKGATRAKKGEKLIIPINMRDGSIIAVGKGNSDWNQSAPHGAGRMMSRSKAKAEISLKDFKKEMSHVWTSSVNTSTLDEAPMAYKPTQEIIDHIQDTVEILEIIKPVYNFKAGDE